MKKIDVMNLIKNHFNNDEEEFRKLSNQIADNFYEEGDKELANIIYGFISDAYAFLPQEQSKKIGFMELVNLKTDTLFFPETIMRDIVGIHNAIKRNIGVNKFLFYGDPGTGKTEAAKLLAKKLNRNLWKVSIRDLIDSKLGETSKNIHSLFEDINNYSQKNKMVVLFDEIDSLALNRSDSRDLREMSRATTELFVGLDSLDKNIVLIATTNLFKDFDEALIRRFQKRVDFSRYSKDELIELGCVFYEQLAEKVKEIEYDKRFIRKILSSYRLPYPGDLKNLISSSIAFSDPKNPCDYYSRLITSLDNHSDSLDINKLQEKGFTLREIAKILNSSKSVIGRKLNNGKKTG